MSSAKVVFESNLVLQHSSNCSAIFRYVSSVTNQRSLPSIMHLGLSPPLVTREMLICSIILFSVFFHHFPSIFPFSPSSCMLSFIKVSHDVYQALGSLDPFESTGIDGIGPRVLKFCSAALVDMFITYFHYHYLVVVYLRSGKHKIHHPCF